MKQIDIPGFGVLEIENCVFDYNGSLATDGKLIVGVKERLIKLSHDFSLFCLTADTHGNVKENLRDLPIVVKIISNENQTAAKADFIKEIDAKKTVFWGNGRNDESALGIAALGVGIIGEEGLTTKSLLAADIVCSNVLSALDLLLFPKRLIATLRR